VAALTLVSNTQVLPRANERLAAVISGGAPPRSDRTMTVSELRVAARGARADAAPNSLARAASYEVEIQKKYALAAACVVLALTAVAVALRFPRGGMGTAISTGCAVFAGYYISLVAGETLADRLVLSPLVAMWMANAFLFTVASALVWRRGAPTTVLRVGSL
jgi:lipopolysaccharide export system permease protein